MTRLLAAILLAIAACALIVPALVVTYAPRPARAPHHRIVRPPQRVVPPAEVPPVEPVAYAEVTPDDARAFNAGVPFSTLPNPAARPFRLGDAAADQARATDCLAAAAIYEAGDDATGERAVAQVVLNRLRHPAFPKSVCAVVFQGAERSTGCQFTFTCDGALERYQPSEAAWERARKVAAAALTGSVFKKVGYATHYHTDWVVPYWQSSLDKIAAVGTHLFFRWTGWWGTPPAFRLSPASSEPSIAKLAKLSPAHREALVLDGLDPTLVTAALAGGGIKPSASDPDAFLVTLDPSAAPEGFVALAERACGDRVRCRFSGWADPRQTPAALPLEPAQVATQAFSYIRDRSTGLDKALWNCRRYPRTAPGRCMKQQVLGATGSAPDKPASPALAADAQAEKPLADRALGRPLADHAPLAIDGLSGVRRATPQPAPTSKARSD